MSSGPKYVRSINGLSGDLIMSLAAQTVSYVQEIPSPVTVVTVNHYLGLYPVVVVQDSAGDTLIADVAYVSADSLRVTFSVPTTGTIYCN